MRGVAAILVLMLGLTSSSAAAAPGAIAVMPFRNLSGNADLDWLKLGIAETLMADLQKDGSRPVVERTEIDRALAELALQTSQGSDDGVAASAGKLVGAETVVVGGFQASGTGKAITLRLTARFVSVQTGVVTDTAKVDGAVADVFALQDQIVARLLKKPPRAPRPKARAPEKRAEAFRVYAMSLSTSSQVEQVKYLKEAVALDPDFVYASDDLAALESRLRRYRRDAAVLQDQASQQLVAQAFDVTIDPQQRVTALMTALPTYSSSRRWQTLRSLTTSLLQREDLPRTTAIDTREFVSYFRFLSLLMLKETDLALQAGEAHLKAHPIGSYSGSVDSQLQAIIGERQRRADAMAGIPAALKEIDDDEAEVMAKPKLPDNLRERQRLFEFRRCSVVYQGKDYDDAVRRCEAFARAWPDDEPQHLARLGRYFAGMSHAEQGRFDEARIIMNNLADEDATWARSMAIPTFITMWPVN